MQNQSNAVPNLTVQLSHSANPDIMGGYWQEPMDSGRAQRVMVTSLESASRICREYIDRNTLGGGNWTGGTVRDGSKVVAKISYNGRIWPTAA